MNRPTKNTLTTIVMLLLLLALPLKALARGVVLNFNDVDISTMVKFISDLTGKNFIMDDRVKGKISVFSPATLSKEEAFNVFTSVLELKGFTIVQAGRVYKVVPTSLARQAGMKIFSDGERGPVNESYVARVITLENIPAQEAVTFLQPVISRDGYISAFGPSNMLLVVDSALNIQKVLGILELIDSDQGREKGELLFLKNASADDVAKVIKEWQSSSGKVIPHAVGQAAAATGGAVVPDSRLNALILFGSPKEKEDIKNLVSLIDVPPPTSSSKVNVCYLENADATDVAKVLEGVVRGSQAPTAAPAVRGGAQAQQSPFAGGNITITPDKATNSLVIMASPTDYQNLLQVIKKLDKPRRQVFVQAVIAEVSLDKLKDVGVQWGLLGAASDGKYASVAGAFDPQGTFSQLFNVLQGFSAAGVTLPSSLGSTPANFGAILKALFTNDATNILSTPTILTSDNKEAEIFVGENVPFITSTSTTGTIATQSVQRQDTGITLKITPQISEGKYVKLDIYQEISAVTPNKGQATDLVTTKRSAKTSVVVKDNDTVVIGGLIQDQDQVTVNKIPILGDIPLIGWLFKTTHKERTKTNLVIILTPRIIRGAEEMADVSATQRKKFSDAVKSDSPFDIDRELKLVQPPKAGAATPKP